MCDIAAAKQRETWDHDVDVEQLEMHGRTSIIWSRDGSTKKEQTAASERNGRIKIMGAASEPITRASLWMEERSWNSEDGPIGMTWARTSGLNMRNE